MSRKNTDTAFIVPVYNEGGVIEETINSLINKYEFVICVNDGSTDNSEIKIRKTGAHLVNHIFNMGQGAAIQTGIEYALSLPGIKYIVTFDADGQHNLKDAERMIMNIKNTPEVDVLLGSRFLGKAEHINKVRLMALKVAVLFTRLSTGLQLTDTHNGLRVFTRNAAKKIDIKLNDMAHASEILSIIGENKLSYKEIPVTIKYTDYSKSKGQSIWNSVNIISDIFFRGRI